MALYGLQHVLTLPNFLQSAIAAGGTMFIASSVLLLVSASGLVIQSRRHPAATNMRKTTSATGNSDVVIAAITDGVIALDPKGIIQLINPSAQKIIGWNKEDVLGLSYRSVLKLYDARDQQPEPINDPIQQALTTNQQTHTETMKLETADSGRKFLADITASPVGASDMGEGVIVVFRDITREKAEEREQAEFISTASHEMRTPVASIEGFLGLALNPRTAAIDDNARSYITKAQDSVKHLGQLFQDLLDVSRADDGRLTNNPETIDITTFLHDITQGLLPKATEKKLRIDFRPQPDLYGEDERDPHTDKRLAPAYYLDVDKGHLREVLANLIENAIKYTPTGSVTIDITGDERHVTISVADSGIGIPKEDIPHLFQKFYRVDNTDTREIGGTGLGLYLSRKLTEAMGGKLWVESVYKQGSTFYLQLPRLDTLTAVERLKSLPENQSKVDMPADATTSPAPAQPPVTSSPTKAAIPAQNRTPVNSGRPSLTQLSPAPIEQAQTPAPQPAAAQPPVVQQPQQSTTPPQTQSTTPVQPPIPQNPIPVPTPVATPVIPQRQNIPLSSIESHPEQYIRRAPIVSPRREVN